MGVELDVREIGEWCSYEAYSLVFVDVVGAASWQTYDGGGSCGFHRGRRLLFWFLAMRCGGSCGFHRGRQWMICLVAATSCDSCGFHSCRIFVPVLMVVMATRLSALFVLVDLRREMMTCLVEKTMRMATFVVVVVVVFATMRWSTFVVVVVVIEKSAMRVFLPK